MSILTLAILALPAAPDVRAHFQPTFIDGGCWVNSQRPWGAGDPDRFYRVAIFDESNGNVFNACADGCGDDGNENTVDGVTFDDCGINTGCGGWDIGDPEVSKVIPRNSGAWFYLGLWDDDFDANDSLGDNWFFASGYISGTYNNNNAAPYYADNPIGNVCGNDVEGVGDANNFSVSLRVWFTDDDGPVFSEAPVAIDNGAISPTDDDDTMEFLWTPASDEDSGVVGHYITMQDLTTGVTVIENHFVVGSSISIGLDPAANIPFPPSQGHTYRFWVGAKNGFYPHLNDRFGGDGSTVTWSDPVDVLITSALPEFYCSTSPNSASSRGARINFGGSNSVSANDLQIIANFAPAGQPGLFYYGPNQVEVPFGNGVRCIGGFVTRMNPPIAISAPWGEAIHFLDATSPINAANLQPGTAWNFQFWFRDPAGGGAGFNLTDAVRIPFTP